ASAFLQMRREAVRKGGADFPEHSAILGYERRGTSRRYSWYALPKNCDTIFFPGCTLTGTRSDKVAIVFEHLKKQVPNLGIVLDCCTKPSHDLGREDHFHAMFGEMKSYLTANSIRNVLVACPNCYRIFRQYGEEFSVKTVYEVLAENGLPETAPVSGTVTIHDPCAIRFEEQIHGAVRELIARKGLAVSEMAHHGKKTLCCGEGGSVGFLSPELSKKWASTRQAEAQGRMMITYCAGCANALGGGNPTGHILDLLLEPQQTLAGKAEVTRAPWTYLKRIRLKKKLQREMNPAVSRERTFSAEKKKSPAGLFIRLGILLLLIGGVWAVRSTGASGYLDQEALRNLIQSYGLLAPLFYMLVYALAPALFLPGLPITVAGGILFGPFWGVVYTITSSTVGACVAFLISRYLARDWIERKLRSPRWKRLDEEVERHGWKVVALTRLIPLFPFNLLNYAFGLTKVKFLHYAAATFFCMLPACIAFIVFSSSLLDLIRGRVSPTFIAGICLIILVSLIPVFYRKRQKSRLPSEEPEVRTNGKGEDLS
ncbi:MAG: VTT domain-containing protein, partial [Desulfobacteraceae bacterium]|nr:VTT domain-containing protein [Desulfobacteraceae bacterium]